MSKRQQRNRGRSRKSIQAVEPDRRLIVAFVAAGMIVGALLSDGDAKPDHEAPTAVATVFVDTD